MAKEEKFKRPDGRDLDETREIKAKVGIIKRADGSAMFSFGKSKAIAAVYGPRVLHPQHLQNPEKGILRCYYDMTPFSVSERKRPGPNRRSSEISFVTSRALEPVLQIQNFPNTVVDCYILIVEADASTRCAGINAASLALANAGLSMSELVTAVSVGKTGDHFVVDISKEEEDYKITKDGKEIKAATDIPFAILSRSEKISLLQLDGKIKANELKEAIELAKKTCKKIAEIQKKALKQVKDEK
jgi:exosome complex component RRP41